MLCELQISNFAIIESQTISFGPGLNVISGETGSGKSIVLQALDLILGGRSKPKYIRTGTDGWELQAFFDLTALAPEVVDELPDIARSEELVISRSMGRNGRGKILINGRLGTVKLLEEICSSLITICSQGQSVRLLQPGYHLDLIDGYAGHAELLAGYLEIYQSWSALSRRLKEGRERLESQNLRRAELEFVQGELAQVQLFRGARGELEAAIARLANSEHLLALAGEVECTLSGDGGISDLLGALAVRVAEMARTDPGFEEVEALYTSALSELAEFERSLSQYVTGIDLDEAGLDELRERLAEIARLERKYRTDDEGLLRLKENVEAELCELVDSNNLEVLEDELAALEEQLAHRAEALTASRKEAANSLIQQVEADLSSLNMANARLFVELQAKPFAADGADAIELLIASNAGESPRSLKEIASGGELSRIMLVLKKVLRDRSGVQVLIFDEVDTGISGGVARSVGSMLRELACGTQVLCITHLAQVASMADRHFLVDKLSGKRTVSVIREIIEHDRIEEIARMLAGYKVTAAARESARELLSSK